MRLRLSNHRGDTIVEVMIAMAVLTFIIGGGYSIATRSLNGVQISQERSEATKVAEGQIEAINQQLSNPVGPYTYVAFDETWSDLWGPGGSFPIGGFCVNDAGTAIQQLGLTWDSTNLTGYDPECMVGVGDRYHIYITTSVERLNYTVPADVDGDPKQLLYRVYVGWPRSGGGPNEWIEMTSRFAGTF